MLDLILGAIAIMLYIAIGVFLDTLLSGCTKPSFWVALIWPLGLLVTLILYFCLIVPTRLADWIKEKGGRHETADYTSYPEEIGSEKE